VRSRLLIATHPHDETLGGSYRAAEPGGDLLTSSDPLFLGAGLGYRRPLHDAIVDNRPAIDWLELITDQFLPLTAESRDELTRLSESFACVPHGLELSVGSSGPLDEQYLSQTCAVADAVHAPWLSDHLCFTEGDGVRLGHLTPLPWTRQVASTVAAKARHVQDVAGRPFLLENISYAFTLGGELTEAEFISTVLELSGCYLLLDVNNLYTNSVNFRFDPYSFLDAIPLDRVIQMHIAGGHWEGEFLEDGHDTQVPEPVWHLAEFVTCRADVRGVLLERDDAFPDDFQDLLAEVGRARTLLGTPPGSGSGELSGLPQAGSGGALDSG
jgi:uncharacterized protein (UPF0276 family)